MRNHVTLQVPLGNTLFTTYITLKCFMTLHVTGQFWFCIKFLTTGSTVMLFISSEYHSLMFLHQSSIRPTFFHNLSVISFWRSLSFGTNNQTIRISKAMSTNFFCRPGKKKNFYVLQRLSSTNVQLLLLNRIKHFYNLLLLRNSLHTLPDLITVSICN